MEQPEQNNENVKKQGYINDNIIEKGYNLDELSAYIVYRRGLSIEELSFAQLKGEIDSFKNEKLKDTYKSVKNNKVQTKEEEQLSDLYSDQTISVKFNPRQECKLALLDKENKKISIKITDEHFEKVGFFGHNIFICKINCEELGSCVQRSLEDLEWFKNQLNERHPLIYIPPIPPKDKSDDPKLKKRIIEKFFKALLRKKLLRISPLLQEFLRLDKNDFDLYKETLNKRKFHLKLNMENFKSNKTEYSVNFTQNQIYLPEFYLKKFEPYKNIYNNLEQSLSQISSDYKTLSQHIKEMSDIFGEYYKAAKDTEQTQQTKDIYEQLKITFNNWSKGYEKQSRYFFREFKEFFNYLNLETNELNTIDKQYQQYRNDYEQLGLELLNKREKLFYERKYSKWELKKEDEQKLDSFKDNYYEAVKYICKDFSKLVSAQKILVACSCNLLMKEYGKTAKYFGEQVQEFFDNFQKVHLYICKDTFNTQIELNKKIRKNTE